MRIIEHPFLTEHSFQHLTSPPEARHSDSRNHGPPASLPAIPANVPCLWRPQSQPPWASRIGCLLSLPPAGLTTGSQTVCLGSDIRPLEHCVLKLPFVGLPWNLGKGPWPYAYPGCRIWIQLGSQSFPDSTYLSGEGGNNSAEREPELKTIKELARRPSTIPTRPELLTWLMFHSGQGLPNHSKDMSSKCWLMRFGISGRSFSGLPQSLTSPPFKN